MKAATVEAHARRLLAERWPAAARTLAGKVLRRLADGRRYSVREDLFGAFDGAALVLLPRPELALVQWTTEGAASARRRKVDDTLLRPLGALCDLPPAARELLAVEVWGLRSRAGFIVWRFDFALGAWIRDGRLHRAAASAPSRSSETRSRDLGSPEPESVAEVAP